MDCQQLGRRLLWPMVLLAPAMGAKLSTVRKFRGLGCSAKASNNLDPKHFCWHKILMNVNLKTALATAVTAARAAGKVMRANWHKPKRVHRTIRECRLAYSAITSERYS